MLEKTLREQGYHVVAVLAGGQDLLLRVSQVRPEVIIIGMESPDRDTLEDLPSSIATSPALS